MLDARKVALERPGARAGEIRHGDHVSDPVLIREDGASLHLASVVDDIDFGITHVIRGEDHVTNTGRADRVFEALGATRARFAHFPLLAGCQRRRLSKRARQPVDRRSCATDGIEPMAVASIWRDRHRRSGRAAADAWTSWPASFDFAKFGRAAPHFEPRRTAALNARLLHCCPSRRSAQAHGAAHRGRRGVLGWRSAPTSPQLADVREWLAGLPRPVAPVIDDAGFAAKAAALLPPEPWDDETWGAWTKAVSANRPQGQGAVPCPCGWP